MRLPLSPGQAAGSESEEGEVGKENEHDRKM